MEPPKKKQKKVLFDEDVSDGAEDAASGVSLNGESTEFKVNEEYAKRFEHNKKREEFQKCMSIKSISEQNAD